MIPVSGFFEFGLSALVGSVGMIALGIWALLSDERESNQIKNTLTSHYRESEFSGPITYRKAA